MYTWGYVKEATLAELDMSLDEVTEIGLLNKFPFYANEAITQICSSIKAKATFARFNVWDKYEYFEKLIKRYNLPVDFDFSFLWKVRQCNVEDLPIAPYNMQKMWQDFHNDNIVFTGDIVRMPEDFINFGDDINRVTREPYIHNEEVSDTDWNTMGTNSVMFKKFGDYLLSYDARWITFTPSMKDEEELDIPMDILDCLPCYIAYKCLKIDDEAKANTYRSEFEVMCSRIEENKARTNKIFITDGGW